MAQINARLPSDVRTRFSEYAEAVGLDAGELARLLIVRELRVRQALRSPARTPVLKTPKAPGQRKLTAHFHSPDLVAEFDKHAHAHGLSRDAAAKLVFLRELEEMWLSKAFSWSPKRR